MANVSLIDSLLDSSAPLPSPRAKTLSIVPPLPVESAPVVAPIVVSPDSHDMRGGSVVVTGGTPLEAFDAMTKDLRGVRFGVRRLYTADGQQVPSDVGRCIVNESTGEPLQVHGSRYTPMQPATLCDQARALVETGLVTPEKAFSYDHGRVYGVSCKVVGSDREVTRGDAISARATFGSSVDGSTASSGSLHSHRVICENTARLAITMGLRVRHTQGANVRIAEVQAAIAATLAQWDKLVEKYRFLAGRYPTSAQLREFVASVVAGEKHSLYPDHQWKQASGSPIVTLDVSDFLADRRAQREAEEQEEAKRRAADDVLDRILALNEQEEIPAARGTMWGAYNAVTKYLTHERSRTSDTRAISNAWGPSANTAGLALSRALDFAQRSGQGRPS